MTDKNPGERLFATGKTAAREATAAQQKVLACLALDPPEIGSEGGPVTVRRGVMPGMRHTGAGGAAGHRELVVGGRLRGSTTVDGGEETLETLILAIGGERPVACRVGLTVED